MISVLGSENKKATRRGGETERERSIPGDQGVMKAAKHVEFYYFLKNISSSCDEVGLISKQQHMDLAHMTLFQRIDFVS